LKWKQIGVKDIMGSGELPFFIQWLTGEHPSKDGKPVAKIVKIIIATDDRLTNSWFQDEINSSLVDVEIELVKPEINYGEKGIFSVEFSMDSGNVLLL